MKLRNTIVRSVVIIVILCLAMLCGLVYQSVWHRIDLKNHPRDFSEYVTRYSAEYGVPEYILYAVIKTESNFESNKLSEDGEIGLMQLSPETFDWLTTMTKEDKDAGILYDPETNIRYGAYMMSYLYTEYSRWNTVFAIMDAGQSTVDQWMLNRKLVDELGNLVVFPDEKTETYVNQVNETTEVYRSLYYTNP
ncbi:MAG: lytic transglycosylase domain-containing protein [Clostridia bacterium]|nr:lytic transglycosylase domain-containing protein [Clostridia bacterium]